MRRYVPTSLLALAALSGCDAPSSPRPNLTSSTTSPAAAFENGGFAAGTVSSGGTWRYGWNNTLAQWGRLRIELPSRVLADIPCNVIPPPHDCGGFTGRSETRRAFAHVYFGVETNRHQARSVLLLAWGDDAVFETAVLPDTPGNRDLINSAPYDKVDDTIGFVQRQVALSTDVVRGQTIRSNYYGEPYP